MINFTKQQLEEGNLTILDKISLLAHPNLYIAENIREYNETRDNLDVPSFLRSKLYPEVKNKIYVGLRNVHVTHLREQEKYALHDKSGKVCYVYWPNTLETVVDPKQIRNVDQNGHLYNVTIVYNTQKDQQKEFAELAHITRSRLRSNGHSFHIAQSCPEPCPASFF